MGNELMVINQSDVIGSLKPIGHLPIRHDVDVTVLRKKFFKCAQTEAQFIIVAVPAFNIAKDGNAGSVYSGQITRMFLTLCAPFIIFAVDPQVNDIDGAIFGITDVQTGNVPGNKMLESTAPICVRPQKAIVRSSSLWMISSALVTPASPIAPKPYSMERPM